tara:strand:+ start:472 stop:1167 length:696 start_codon:yes stop_codon:yes gene_type:complete
MDLLTIIISLIGVYFLLDLTVLILDLSRNQSCASDNWMTIGPLSGFLKGKDCESSNEDCKDLGPFKKYKTLTSEDNKYENMLCKKELVDLQNDIISDNIIGGYNASELIPYVILPCVITLCFMWYIISRQVNSGAEFTFWILIATVIWTSFRSLAFDSDLAIIPEESSPLTYITDKLKFGIADELKYSFISRKQNGEECFVDGVVLGGGVSPENQPPTYSGDCDEKTLPLY